MTIETINPATGKPGPSYDEMTTEEVDSALREARAAFERWREVSPPDRARPLRRAAELLRERRRELGELMAREMGKPLSQGMGEADKCAWVCEHYAENARRYLEPEAVETEARESFVTYNPLGVLLAVMPWNFPLWQAFRGAAPALMAGNAVVLKHASNVPGSALAIEQIFRDADLPDGLFRTLLVGSAAVEGIIDNSAVAAVTLTGGDRAGRAVAAQAGARLKKTVLELGGSDPYLILGDADVEAAAKACVTSRLINSGQSCIAAKRFIVVETVREAFEREMVELMEAVVVGDPLDEKTQLGPQARHDLRDDLHDQVRRSVEAGATVRLGGEVPDGPGAFYPPTVLTDVAPGMAAAEEELFGPVAAIIPVADAAMAVRVANDSAFGLGAAVFTKDLERGRTIAAEQLEAGACFVNGFVRSDPRLPFGGVKVSGYGRELGNHGILEFVNIKTVWVE